MDVEVQIGSWVVVINGEPFATCDSVERAAGLAAILIQHAAYRDALEEVMNLRDKSSDQALIAQAAIHLADNALHLEVT